MCTWGPLCTLTVHPPGPSPWVSDKDLALWRWAWADKLSSGWTPAASHLPDRRHQALKSKRIRARYGTSTSHASSCTKLPFKATTLSGPAVGALLGPLGPLSGPSRLTQHICTINLKRSKSTRAALREGEGGGTHALTWRDVTSVCYITRPPPHTVLSHTVRTPDWSLQGSPCPARPALWRVRLEKRGPGVQATVMRIAHQ